MKFKFTLHDIQEIYGISCRAFISTFKYEEWKRSDSDSDFNSPNSESESDLPDFDSDIFGCGEITHQVENMVENNWEVCDPLNQVYGKTTSELIKQTVSEATEESKCAGVKFFNYLTPNQDQNLIEICTEICYWCCCETIKKVSPIIAETTNNLMY